MSPAPSNNPMWIAITVIGGIAAYSMLRKDVVAIADKVGDGVKYVGNAINITKDTNLAYKGAGAIFGEDTIIDKVGGTVASILGTDPMKNYEKETPKKPEIKYQSTNNRASNYRAPATATTPRTAKKEDAGLPARQYNGKWLKLQKGQWLPLTKSDKVFTIRGANVVHHYLWKP